LASAADAALRVASLNLCTDEYVLLLAEPRQVVSVSQLAHSPHETSLWRLARRFPANDGTLESVFARRPNLILTMGGRGRAREALARRLGARVVELPYAASPREVLAQAERIAAAVGRPQAAASFRRRLAALEESRPRLQDGAFLAGAGLSLAPDGLGASWLSLAGFRQPALPGGRLTLEQLATRPPKWLIRSDYRAQQESRTTAWLRHPLVTRLEGRTLVTDGRPWTCGGLPMLAEVARLRSLRGAR
jgi:iron complex transport system substrate-binding protein